MDNAGSRDFSNQSKFVFARSIEYVVIYLHGFTDDGDEGPLFFSSSPSWLFPGDPVAVSPAIWEI